MQWSATESLQVPPYSVTIFNYQFINICDDITKIPEATAAIWTEPTAISRIRLRRHVRRWRRHTKRYKTVKSSIYVMLFQWGMNAADMKATKIIAPRVYRWDGLCVPPSYHRCTEKQHCRQKWIGWPFCRSRVIRKNELAYQVCGYEIYNLQRFFSDSIKNSYRYRNHIPPNIDTAIPRWTKIHFDIWRLNNPARLRRTRFSAGKWIKIRAEQSERRKEKERKKRERILPMYGYKVLGSGLAPSDPRVVRIGKPWSKSADMSMRVGSRLRLVLGKVECAGWEGLFVKGMEEDGILERRY